jgi:hypothetical protein
MSTHLTVIKCSRVGVPFVVLGAIMFLGLSFPSLNAFAAGQERSPGTRARSEPAQSMVQTTNEKAQPADQENGAAQADLVQQQFSPAPQGGRGKKMMEGGRVISDELIPAGSRIYVAPIQDGFDTYIVAGLQRKSVPLVIVVDPVNADYQLSGVSESDKAGWAKMLFFGSQQTNESASIKIVNLHTGNVVFAYSVNKINSVRGKQSSAESVAKHIKDKIRKNP